MTNAWLKIEEYPSKNSIVVTPEKMVAYYKEFSLDKEVHPFIGEFWRVHIRFEPVN